MGVKYAIGVDFGTESGRAVLVSLESLDEIANHVVSYKNGVIDGKLPDTDIKLDSEWALQDPQDYVDVLTSSISNVLKKSGISVKDVVGLGIDFTSSTILPIDNTGVPLCKNERWKDNPHSWVKLWKHHAAQNEATDLTKIAKGRDEKFLTRYGGKISSEWMFPKIWQILKEAPEIYEATDQFIEAADWIVFQLTGKFSRNSCTAGYKALWHKQEGYPSKAFFKSLDPRLEDVIETKMPGEVLPLGTKAGNLTEEMAELTGLHTDVSVAVGVIDAHAAVPAVGAVNPGNLLMAMGTSLCHLFIADEEKDVEGISGIVEDGVIPGYYCYEAGQPAVGDIFGWYIDEGVPTYVKELAKEENVTVHQWLERKASHYQPGETGLLALDWWNGNRSILNDANLSGMLLGMTLQTKPEEIYRALLEATAFGTRKVIEAFENNGLEVKEVYATGGLPSKNKLLMQIYADVTNRKIKIADLKETTAIGAAMFGAVAAGPENGGFATIMDASNQLSKLKVEVTTPIPENVKIYDELYQSYSELYHYFGKNNNIMKDLRAMKNQG